MALAPGKRLKDPSGREWSAADVQSASFNRPTWLPPKNTNVKLGNANVAVFPHDAPASQIYRQSDALPLRTSSGQFQYAPAIQPGDPRFGMNYRGGRKKRRRTTRKRFNKKRRTARR